MRKSETQKSRRKTPCDGGFNLDDLQGYLNLFSFVTNPHDEMLAKVALVIDLAFQNPKILRYREFYGVNSGF